MAKTKIKLESRVLTEKRYVVQWRNYGNWVTYSGDYPTEEDALHELKKQVENERVDWQDHEWRAVEITMTTRRIDDGNDSDV